MWLSFNEIIFIALPRYLSSTFFNILNEQEVIPFFRLCCLHFFML